MVALPSSLGDLPNDFKGGELPRWKVQDVLVFSTAGSSHAHSFQSDPGGGQGSVLDRVGTACRSERLCRALNATIVLSQHGFLQSVN